MHTLNAYLACRGDELFFLGNTPGGDLQPQLNFQSIVNAIDYEMDPQQIAQAPNWSCSVNTAPHDLRTRYVLRLGRFIAPDTVDALEAMGHPINRGDWGGVYARIQFIMKNSGSGVLLGGSRQSVLGY